MQIVPVAEKHDIALPEFPASAWLSMRSSVIEERKVKIENYLRVALLNPALMRPILSFFDVSDEECSQVIAAMESPAKPVSQQLNDGEMLIQTFNARLFRESNNKVRVIEDFDQRFFGIPRFIRYEFSVLLLSDAVPLCGDPVFGSKALDIVYKILSREWVRSHQEFRSALLKLPVEMLATMKLDEYLLGEVRGAANSQAFAVFSVVFDFYQRCGQVQKALRVLNNNTAAMEVFHGWSSGVMSRGTEQAEKKEQKGTEEWVEHSPSESDVSLKHRDKDGFLEVRLAMLIHASPDSVAFAITDWATRQKWDETIISYKQLQPVSDTCELISVEIELDRETIPLVLRKEVRDAENGAVEIAFVQVGRESEEQVLQPMELRYLLTPTVCNSESRKTSGESEGASSDDSCGAASTQSLPAGQLHSTLLIYEIKIGSDLRKFIVPELTGEQNAIKESCLALRKALEAGCFAQCGQRELRPSQHHHSTGNLNAAFDSKILRKSASLFVRKVPRKSLPM